MWSLTMSAAVTDRSRSVPSRTMFAARSRSGMSGSWRIESGSMSASVYRARRWDVELARLLVQIEVDEVAGAGHPGDVFEAGEVDADEPPSARRTRTPPRRVAGRPFQRSPGRRPGFPARLLRGGSCTRPPHAHSAYESPDACRGHDGVEHLEPDMPPSVTGSTDNRVSTSQSTPLDCRKTTLFWGFRKWSITHRFERSLNGSTPQSNTSGFAGTQMDGRSPFPTPWRARWRAVHVVRRSAWSVAMAQDPGLTGVVWTYLFGGPAIEPAARPRPSDPRGEAGSDACRAAGHEVHPGCLTHLHARRDRVASGVRRASPFRAYVWLVGRHRLHVASGPRLAGVAGIDSSCCPK